MSIDDVTPREWDASSKKSQNDPVNAPTHYNSGDVECIDAIQASMTPAAFKGYCKGNALKYIWRMSYKGKPIEDLRKAAWYLDRLIKAELLNPTDI